MIKSHPSNLQTKPQPQPPTMSLTYSQFIEKSIAYENYAEHLNVANPTDYATEQTVMQIPEWRYHNYTEFGFSPATQTPYEMFCQNEYQYLQALSRINIDFDYSFKFDFSIIKQLSPNVQKCMAELYCYINPSTLQYNDENYLPSLCYKHFFKSLQTFDEHIALICALSQMNSNTIVVTHPQIIDAVGENMFNQVKQCLKPIAEEGYAIEYAERKKWDEPQPIDKKIDCNPHITTIIPTTHPKMPITYEEFILKSHALRCIQAKISEEENEDDAEEDIAINEMDDVLFTMCKNQQIASKLVQSAFIPEAQMPYEMFCQNEKKYLHCMYQPNSYHDVVLDFDYLKTLAPKLQKCFVEMHFKRNSTGILLLYIPSADDWQYFYQSLETFDDFIDFYKAINVMQKQETQHNKLLKVVGEKMFGDVIANINHILYINQQHDKNLKQHMIRDYETKLKAQNATLTTVDSPTTRVASPTTRVASPTEIEQIMSIVEQHTTEDIAKSQTPIEEPVADAEQQPEKQPEQMTVEDIFNIMQQGNQSYFSEVTNLLNMIMQNLDNNTTTPDNQRLDGVERPDENAIPANTPISRVPSPALDAENVEQFQFDAMIREIMQTNEENAEQNEIVSEEPEIVLDEPTVE